MIVNSFSSSSSSWEEKAFAEDIISNNFQGIDGSVGGCVWPPRSYSCAFCLREFRSAQALGGHMNIHRRDRARLKQKSLNNNNNNNNMFCPQTSCSSSTDNIFDQSSPLKVKPLVNNLNNLDPSSSSSFYSCPNRYVKTQPRSYPSRVSSHVPQSDGHLSIGVMLDLEEKKKKNNNNNNNNPRELFEDYYDRSTRAVLKSDDHNDDIMVDYKASGDWKRPAELLFLLKPLQSAVNNIREVKAVASMDDLDLELRLGHAKVL